MPGLHREQVPLTGARVELLELVQEKPEVAGYFVVCGHVWQVALTE